MCAVQQMDQPATAEADVSFPDGLSQHGRWNDRYLLINIIASANFFLRVSVGQVLLLPRACPQLHPGLPSSSWGPNNRVFLQENNFPGKGSQSHLFLSFLIFLWTD